MQKKLGLTLLSTSVSKSLGSTDRKVQIDRK